MNKKFFPKINLNDISKFSKKRVEGTFRVSEKCICCYLKKNREFHIVANNYSIKTVDTYTPITQTVNINIFSFLFTSACKICVIVLNILYIQVPNFLTNNTFGYV